MLKKVKRLMALVLSLVMVLSSVTVYADDTTDTQTALGNTLTVDVDGKGTVTITGEAVTPLAENQYKVLPGATVSIIVLPADGYQVTAQTLNGESVTESFVMPDQDAALNVVFELIPQQAEEPESEKSPEIEEAEIPEASEEPEESVMSDVPELSIESEYVTNSKGIRVKKSLLCNDNNCLEDHVGITLVPDGPVSAFNAKRKAVPKLVEDPYVGMVLSGSNASVRFLGVPGTAGDFSVSINDGLLSGVTGTGWCINHGAANPGEYGETICTWEATCTAINGDVATWSFVLTPPGACEPGTVLGYQRVGLTAQVQFESKGHLDVYKSSANPDITDNNTCYSLADAVYGLYQNGALIKTATTDAKGYAHFADVKKGNYILKEITPPKGYALDLTEYLVTINSKQTTKVNVKDYPQSDPVAVLLGKIDRETTQNMPQGSASLEGAEFTFKYYDGFYDTDPAEQGEEAVRTWVFATDADGFLYYSAEYKVSGDDFYYQTNGDATIPLGTLTIQETKAPEGYLLNEEVFVRQITPDGTAEWVNTYNEPTIPEDVIRGDIQIVKYGENNDETEDSGADIKHPLEGVKFHLTSKTTGEVFTIITDENGIASTVQLGLSERGNLPFDTYTVTEESPYPEYDPVAPFEVTVNEEGKTYYYILRNDTVDAPIQVQKIDETTGKVIPVAGAQFQILDQNKNPITMIISRYPDLIETDTFETDASGMFVLPEKLEYGTYYLHEVLAPEGYLLGGEDIQFVVDQEYQWDNPLTIQYADVPAMGQIKIVKTDAETGNPLIGAEFTVTAAEDIVTPDGTVRAAAGEVVDTITSNADGEAVLKNLFLGKYTVTETKQPTGYVLPDQSWEVELTYKDQHTEIVVETLEVTNTPTVVIIDKKVTGSEQRLSGVKFAIWNRANEDPVDPGMTYKPIYTTPKSGQIRLERLKPGTYGVQEVSGVPGYAVDDTVHEFTVTEDGRVEGLEEYTLTVENPKTEITETNVVNVKTGNQQAYPEQIDAVDTVSLVNLMPGTEYQLKSVIVDSVTGFPIRERNFLVGDEMVAEKTFIAEDSVMDVEMELTIDASELAGRTVTVFEYLYQDGVEISSHADKNDEKQQLTIKKPGIYTTVIDVVSGTQTAEPDEDVHIRDKVYHSDLIPGVYQMRGVVMSVSTGLPLVVNGEEVVTEKEVTINESEGTFDMDFRFDASELAGQQIVIYEYLYQDGKLIVSHEDINAKNQTIWFKEVIQEQLDSPSVKTGDDGEMVYHIVGLSMMVVSAGLLIYAFVSRKRKNKWQEKDQE